MKFEKELNDVKLLYDQFLEEKKRTERRLAEFDGRIAEKNRETINPEIREKVEAVYQSIGKTYERLVAMEEVLGKDSLRKALNNATPNFKEEQFLVELRENYERFSVLVGRYCQKGVDSPNEVILGMALCYANIKKIKDNLENYLKKHVREDEVKAKAVAEVKGERERYLTQRNSEVEAQKQDVGEKIKRLKEKISEYSSGIDDVTVFGKEPKVNADFSENVSLVIGRANETSSKKETFSELGQTVKLPNSYIEEISLSATGSAANVLIKYTRPGEDEDPDGLYEVIKSLVVRFAQCYPAYFKKICTIHHAYGSQLINIMGTLRPNKNLKLMFSGTETLVENEQDGIRSTINTLGKKLEERMGLLSSGGYNNMIEYNAANSDNAESLILLVIKDYPNGFDESTQKRLRDCMRDANRYGIYLLLISPDSEDNQLTKLCKNVYTYMDNALITEKVSIEPSLGLSNVSSAYVSAMFENFDKYKSVIHFRDINRSVVRNASDVAKGFSAVLDIPIGKEDTSIISLKLNSMDTGAHCVICGGTGSGKSSLLQNIVLGGAYRYSPEQLQIWLLDFKDGAGFTNYGGLKHVRMMALKNKRKDAAEILKYLGEELHARMAKVAEAGDIVNYNIQQKKKGEPLMPRLIVVIDEYTQMSRMHECIEILKHIAQQGRSAGISLIMCSQLCDSSFDETVSQADHRFEFANNKLGRLVEVRNEAQEAQYLGTLKGNALYSSGGYNGTKRRIRVAYAGSADQQKQLIEEINAIYPEYKYTPPITMGKPDMSVKPAASLKVDAAEVEREYKQSKDKSVTAKIGETRLGKVIDYKINSENPLLFLFGDETRLASVEYSLLKRFSKLADGKVNTYYVDLLRSADRSDNVMLAWGRREDPNIRFVRSLEELAATLKELKREYDARNERLSMEMDVGKPIELVIHVADELSMQLRKLYELDGKNTQAPRFSSGSMAVGIDPDAASRLMNAETDEDLDALFDSQFGSDSTPSFKETAVAEAEEEIESIDYLAFFRELFANGKKVRMYMMLQYSNMGAFSDYKQELFGTEPNLKDVIVIPGRAAEGEVSYKQIVDCLRAARQENFAGLYGEGDSDASELEYAIVIDESQPTKVLPYEWSIDK